MPRGRLKNKRISVDTLLSIMDETPEDRARRSHAGEFIRDYDIKEGTVFVPNSIIYYLYSKDDRYKNKITRKMFFTHFSKIIKTKFTKSGIQKGYKLDKDLVYSEEDMIQARIMVRKETYETDITKRARKREKKKDQIKEE